jgi:hypothetical protein
VTEAIEMDPILANKCTIESVVNIPTRSLLLYRAYVNGIGVPSSLQVHLQPFLSVVSLVNIVMEYAMMYNDLLQIGNCHTVCVQILYDYMLMMFAD